MNITYSNIKGIIQGLFDKFYFQNINVDFDAKSILEEYVFDYNKYYTEKDIIYNNLFSRLELVGILLYRIARWLYENGNEDMAYHYSNLGRLISGFEIYYSADIGKGLKINHGLGLVIGARCKIGENVLLHQNVTIGDRHGERPTIQNNVIIYAGAKILGGITLGNHSIIGANCVCMKNVPDRATMVGIPGRLI